MAVSCRDPILIRREVVYYLIVNLSTVVNARIHLNLTPTVSPVSPYRLQQREGMALQDPSDMYRDISKHGCPGFIV